jgi:hypothetical protein
MYACVSNDADTRRQCDICHYCALIPYSYYIATHPEVEAKITAELASRDLLASPENPLPRPLEHDDLSELTYLGAAVKVHLSGHNAC